MGGYNLTGRQKDLLRKLVTSVQDGSLSEPIWGISSSDSTYILMNEPQSLPIENESDLEVLCEVDLMGYSSNPSGERTYYIKQFGYEAVQNDFSLPDSPPASQVNIGNFIHSMAGGNVQGIGFAHAQVSQIVNDPALFQETLDKCIESLVDQVKGELKSTELRQYIQALEEFKEQVLQTNPEPSAIKQVTSTLAFLGDVEGSLGLMVRTWPFVQPLITLAFLKWGA